MLYLAYQLLFTPRLVKGPVFPHLTEIISTPSIFSFPPTPQLLFSEYVTAPEEDEDDIHLIYLPPSLPTFFFWIWPPLKRYYTQSITTIHV